MCDDKFNPIPLATLQDNERLKAELERLKSVLISYEVQANQMIEEIQKMKNCKNCKLRSEGRCSIYLDWADSCKDWMLK